MIWFFARGSQSLQVETRYDNVTAEFLLVVPRPDGRKGVREIERFRDADAFRTRLEALQEQLEADHWTAVGQPVLLKDGWKLT